MQRRRLLAALPAAATAGLAGCLGDLGGSGPTEGSTTAAETTTTPEGPSGVYVQTFMDEMVPAGMESSDDLGVMAMLSIPHDFWNLNGESVEKTAAADADSFHLMTSVFDREANVVLPGSASTEVVRDGDTVTQEVTYPMLAQRMGFHYGANFQVPEYGDYTARVTFEGLGSTRTTGALEGKYDSAVTVEIPFDWSESVAEQFEVRDLEQGGMRGAVKPMSMDAPQGVAPAADALPGETLGEAVVDGARVVGKYVEGGGRFADADYLYVSARTKYNGFVVPMLALSATVDRDGETAFDGQLEPTLDAETGYHYGAAVDDVRGGDAFVVDATLPAQVARHEGYERAFRQMDAVSFTV